MLEVISQPEECINSLDCLKVCVETDKYVEVPCSPWVLTKVIDTNFSNGNLLQLTLLDTDGVTVLMTQGVTFFSSPIDVTDPTVHVLIGATPVLTGQALFEVLMSNAVIMQYLTVEGHVSGSNYEITFTGPCGDYEVQWTNSGATYGGTSTAGADAIVTDGFKAIGRLVEWERTTAFSGTQEIATLLVDNIDFYFDKANTACANLGNRLRSILGFHKHTLTNLLDYYPEWHKNLKLTVREYVEGTPAITGLATTDLFLAVNSETQEGVDCGIFLNTFNQYLSLCQNQQAFIYFFIKATWSETTLDILGHDGEVAYTLDDTDYELIPTSHIGLISINVNAKFLHETCGIPYQDSLTFVLNVEGREPESYTVNYKCDSTCDGITSFLFLSPKGIYEPIALRFVDAKLKTKKELVKSCSTCDDQRRIFSVDTSVRGKFVTGRFNVEFGQYLFDFLRTRETIRINDSGVYEVLVDEGESYTVKVNNANEITIEYGLFEGNQE